MSLRIPTRTLRTPRRPAGAERLVVRPRGNSACALLRCGYRVAHGPGPGRGSPRGRERDRCIVVCYRPRWCANKFTNPGAHETLREMCAPNIPLTVASESDTLVDPHQSARHARAPRGIPPSLPDAGRGGVAT